MTGQDDKLPLSRTQRLVRLTGAVMLFGCALMVIFGLTVWEDDLRGPQFALYWSWCFLLTFGAIVMAAWDMLLVRRAFKQNRRELFHREFMTDELAAKIRDAIRRDEDGR
jgi:TRAP-type C4-dicarboxylate transport system permease small subunit